MYVRVGTHKRLFSEGLDTSPCVLQIQFMTGMLRVYSAEAERYIYRSAVLCAAPCNGEEENVLRSLAAGFGKKRAPT